MNFPQLFRPVRLYAPNNSAFSVHPHGSSNSIFLSLCDQKFPHPNILSGRAQGRMRNPSRIHSPSHNPNGKGIFYDTLPPRVDGKGWGYGLTLFFQSTQTRRDRGYRPSESPYFAFLFRNPGHRPQRFLGSAAGSDFSFPSHQRFSSNCKYRDE